MSKELEQEIVIYAKVNDVVGLEQDDSKEDHYQLEAKFDTGKRCRLRVIDGEPKQMLFTIKIDSEENNISSSIEHTAEVDEKFVEVFKAAAEREITKTRYVFHSTHVTMKLVNTDGKEESINLPSVKYEVDLYKKADGNYSEWCKIDMEVDGLIEYIDSHYQDISDIKLMITVSHLPFKPSNAILMSVASEEDKSFVDSLWKNELCRTLS